MNREPASSSPLRRALARCALPSLVALYVVVESLVIAHTVAPARDGERYMEFALRLQEEPWRDVLRTSVDHPGYPVAVRAAFELGDLCGLSSPLARVRIAQTVAAAFGLIFLLSAWWLFRMMLGAWPAWCGALCLALLPRMAWTMADVLSDPGHAAFWLLGLACATYALERRRLLGALGAGAAAFLAYTMRVDALTLPFTIAAGLAGHVLLRPLARRPDLGPWEPRSRALLRAVLTAGCAAVGVAAAMGVFLAIYGRISPKPIASVLLEARVTQPDGGGALTLLGTILPATERAPWPSLVRWFKVLGQQVQFYHLGAAIIGATLLLALRRLSIGRVLALAAVATYGGLHVALEISVGYASGRYMTVLAPLVILLGLDGLDLLRQLVDRFVPERHHPFTRSLRPLWPMVAVVTSLSLSIPSLASRSLHFTYAEVIEAGRWCAEALEPGDTVFDPYFYPTYLQGLRPRMTKSPEPPSVDPGGGDAGRHFVILRQGDLADLTELSRLVDAGRTQVAHAIDDPRGRSERNVRVLLVRRPE